MEQEAKTNFSFASIAVSFFILIVLPLTITGVIISKGVVKVGEEATQANLRILDDNQKLSIGGHAQNIADAVAQFLSDTEKDIRIASILPRDESSYTTFLRSNTRGAVEASKVGIVKIPVPVFREIAFLNKDGMEVLKVTNEGVVPKDKLRNMSDPKNGEFGSEEYFLKAKGMAPGEFYMGPVAGRHVNKAEFAGGKKFDGIIRMAAPVFDSNGFAGVVELALNEVHLMEFTNHIMPTEPGMVYAQVNTENTDYAFMVDRDGFIIAHPDQYLIRGLDASGNPVPVMDEQNYKQLSQTGDGAENVLKLGFLDENLPKVHALAAEGKAGSLTYTVGDKRIFMVYAPIPFYGSGFSKPQGFGWIGMVVDIDKYHHLSQEKVQEIQQKVERWQKSSIVVVFVSLILLFAIALILARGLYRSIQSAKNAEIQKGRKYDDED